jgi:hypothetical protein
MASSSSSNSKRSAYDSFLEVDQLVAKPVMGSDGAASWQEFQKKQEKKKRPNAAPMAPLKASDRAAGFSSWEQERKHEDEVRKKEGQTSLQESGYTNFSQKGQQEGDDKHTATANRTRPDKMTYFLPASAFEGWKFDYVFTTRDRGTGYYWDGMDSVKQGKPETAKDDGAVDSDRRMAADDSAGAVSKTNSVTTRTATELTDDSQIRKKKKKKKTKLQGPVIVNDPNNPLEQLAAALQRQQQRASLPTGWEAASDATTGNTFYHNRSTGERSWEPPTSSMSSSGLPTGWSAATDSSTGKEYYYHAATKETRWDRPT